MKFNVFVLSLALCVSFCYVDSAQGALLSPLKLLNPVNFIPNPLKKLALKEVDNAKNVANFVESLLDKSSPESIEEKRLNNTKNVLQEVISEMALTPLTVKSLAAAKADAILQALNKIDENIATLKNKYPSKGLKTITDEVKNARDNVDQWKAATDAFFHGAASWQLIEEYLGSQTEEVAEEKKP